MQDERECDAIGGEKEKGPMMIMDTVVPIGGGF